MSQIGSSYQTALNANATAQDIPVKHKSAVEWTVAFSLIAAMPVLHALATWDWDGQISGANYAVRHYSLTVIWLELVVLLLAARRGWRPHQQFLEFPATIKWLCLILCLSLVITSILVSNFPITSALFAIRYLLHGLLIGSLIFLISAAREFEFRKWVAPLLWGIALYVTALATFCLLIPDPQNFPWVERIPSATNIRQIGNVLGLMALVPTTLLFFERSIQKMLIAALLLTALLSFIMWSGSRGSLLGFGVAIFFAGWRSRGSLKMSRTMLLGLSCSAALAISLVTPIPDPNLGLGRMAQSIVSHEPSSGRWQVWQSTLEAIKTNLFFGYGAGTFRGNMEPLTGQPFNHPHNFLLQFIYDWGILGGGLVLGLLAWFGFSLLSSSKGSVEERFLSSSAFVGIITMALTDGALFYPLPIIMAITFMAPHVVRRYA